MEKRTLVAFLLIIVYFTVWSQFAQKKDTQPLDRQEIESEEKIYEPKAEPEKTLPLADKKPKSFLAETTTLEKTQIGDYFITYSTQGGYIQSIAFGNPENVLPFQNIGLEPQRWEKDYQAAISRNRIIFQAEGLPDKEFIFTENIVEITGVTSSSILLFSLSLDSVVSHIDQRYFEVFYYKDGSLKRERPTKVKEDIFSEIKYAGARSKYYTISLLKDNYAIEWDKDEKITNLYLRNPSSNISLYVGPQETDALALYGLEEIVYYGFWHFLAVLIIKALYFLYGFFQNWGLSIIALSLLTYALLFPFTAKSTKAMHKMQEVQPLVQELREKYKENPQKMQKATMELYKEHNVNPLGGCLPLFFQFPIVIAFYQVVFRFPALRGASFLWIKDLSMPDMLFQLPFTIPILRINYFNLLPVLVMALGIIQQQLIAPSGNPQQKKTALFMGVLMGAIFYNFPSALVLYWFIQSFLTLCYQSRLKKARTQTNYIIK